MAARTTCKLQWITIKSQGIPTQEQKQVDLHGRGQVQNVFFQARGIINDNLRGVTTQTLARRGERELSYTWTCRQNTATTTSCRQTKKYLLQMEKRVGLGKFYVHAEENAADTQPRSTSAIRTYPQVPKYIPHARGWCHMLSYAQLSLCLPSVCTWYDPAENVIFLHLFIELYTMWLWGRWWWCSHYLISSCAKHKPPRGHKSGSTLRKGDIKYR